ncbi:MAG TPA: four helix bundle protein [bacterium]|nr:four helix bundle protein [bacterium]
MAHSDFMEVDVNALCDDLAGEINKTYQNLPWALKHEAVSRLKRQVHALSQAVAGAKKSASQARTEKLLEEATSLAHECVPLMSLALKKNLLSAELQERWAKRLTLIDRYLEQWKKASSR